MSGSERLDLEKQNVTSHFELFIAILSTNIIATLSSIGALFIYLSKIAREKHSTLSIWTRITNLKPIYTRYLLSLSVDIICNIFSSFRYLSTVSFQIHEIFTLFSLNLTILQIYSVLLIIFEIQRVFAVLDVHLERIIRPTKLGLSLLSLIAFSCITGLHIFEIVATGYHRFVFLVEVFVFLFFSLASALVVVYSLYLIRQRIRIFSQKKKEGFIHQSQLEKVKSDSEIAQADKLQYLILSLVIIVFILIGFIGALFILGISMSDEAVASAASFLTALTLLLYFFFEECKKLALVKPIRRQNTTNRHDIEAEAMKPVNILLHDLPAVSAPLLVHDKSTVRLWE